MSVRRHSWYVQARRVDGVPVLEVLDDAHYDGPGDALATFHVDHARKAEAIPLVLEHLLDRPVTVTRVMPPRRRCPVHDELYERGEGGGLYCQGCASVAEGVAYSATLTP